jgi:CHAD domain-containing protein
MGSSTSAEVAAEVERKYAVDAATVLPTLSGVDGVARMGQPREHHLEAVYYDTATLDLTRHHVTLRRRTGGADAGWHLKLPPVADARTEVRLPLDAGGKGGDGDTDGRADTPPAELLDHVRAVVRDRPLIPVAVLRTRRREHDLLDASGATVAHLCDDEVEAQSLVGAQEAQRWREWEVELDEGDQRVLESVEPHLIGTGATRAQHASKLRRALGDSVLPSEPDPASLLSGRPTALEVLGAYLVEHRAALHQHDAGVRQGDSEPVHKMRVAARRLRSALTTYRPLLGRQVADPLREELRWLGLALSDARDAHVLRRRLTAVIHAEPPELVVGPVVARLEQELGAVQQQGLATAVAALESARYFRLLDALDDLVAALPEHSQASAPASEVPRLVRRDWKRLRREVAAAGRAADADSRDRALHEARKKAKRFRYAAESAIVLHPKEATRMAKAAEAVQEALGDHQDTVVARARLRSLAMTAHLSGENAFTFGRLHALEQWRADRAEADFDVAWRRLSRRRVRRWLTR